jgi:hypothetical protein
VHEGKKGAGDEGCSDHGGEGPAGVAFLVEWEAGTVRDLFGDPVIGSGEGGEQEAAEAEFLKERGEGDAEGEEDPGGAGYAEDAVDGGVGGAGEEESIDHGKNEAERRYAHEVAGELAGATGIPLESGEEAFMPDEGEDDQAADEM